jgi:cytochrome P450
LHVPVAHLPRLTPPNQYTTITIPHPKRSEKGERLSIPIPPNSCVSIPAVIAGYLPQSFADPYTYDPRRFIVATDSTPTTQLTLPIAPIAASSQHANPPSAPQGTTPPATLQQGEETLLSEKTLATQTAYQPWLSGPRACPGRKFSQVEFVAVIATLFSQGIRIGPRGKDAAERAREKERLSAGVKDVVFNMSAVMRREGEVGVRFYRDG